MNIQLINFLELSLEEQMLTREWRNSQDVSKWFFIPYIDEQTHKNWLKSLQNLKPSSIAFVISCENIHIGVTYFHSINYKESCADWGIYIYNAKYKNKGIGKKVLNLSIEYAYSILKLKTIFLDVKKGNEYAIKLYEAFNFNKTDGSKNDNFLRYKKDLKNEKSIN